MSASHSRWLAASVVSLTAVLGVAGTAAAATPFGCRASVSALRPAATLPVLEPYVANRAQTPCATDSAGASAGSVGAIATAGPATAYTYSSSSADQSTGLAAPGATALVSLDGASITNSGNSIVVAGPAQVQVGYGCVNGAAVPSASSTLNAVTVNGQSLVPSQPGGQQTMQLGGGSYVTINQKLQTAASLTERLVFVHLVGVGDFVLGEAQVTQGADPCAGTAASGGGGGPGSGGGNGGGGGGGAANPPTFNACPPGSTLVSSAQYCEIIVPGGQNVGVTRPFAGPTGGTVMTLTQARKRYRSGCLYGPGPKYAIIGTNHADRINGTQHAERILGLGGNDRIAGQGGNDCIDGGAGADRIYGGKGNDRIYGGSGNDRIFLGNGNDRVWGGSGNDRISVGRGQDRVWGGPGKKTITLGNGNDWVWGGTGHDTIHAGTGKDHLFGGSGGYNRIFGPGHVVYANCGPGKHNVAYVNVFGMRYARTHGCQVVRKIHTHTR